MNTPFPSSAFAPDIAIWREFTSREWEVLLLLAHDLDTEQLMARLFIERGSVDNHKYNLGTKLGLKGRDVVSRYARRHRETLHMWYPILCRKPKPGLIGLHSPA
jgi:DNA-binding CsgD family transcriptional regulator